MASKVLIVLMVALTSFAEAQVKFSFTPSEKHSNKLARIKDTRKKLDTYYKYKDKAERKHHKHIADSLKKAAKHYKPDAADLVPTLPDSASARDSLTWAMNTMAHFGRFDEITAYFEQFPARDSLGNFRFDSAALHPDLESRLQSLLPARYALPQNENLLGDLDKFKDGPSQLGGDLPLDLRKDPKEQLEEFQGNVKEEEMVKAQLRMAALKKKYVTIPDLSNPESGVKRNSLEGKPLIDRIYLGGNVSIVSTAPVATDVDVQIGYKLNRQLVVGVGVVWREAFYAKKDSLIAQPKAAHGYSGFVRYKFGKGFFYNGGVFLGEECTAVQRAHDRIRLAAPVLAGFWKRVQRRKGR